ncbi:WD repeat domain-containing protein [Botrytis cinerea]
MRSLEDSRKRWQVTIKSASNLTELKKSLRIDGENSPCNGGLRSICWKTFLLFQNTEITGWARGLEDSRSAYTSLREHFLRFIEHPNNLGSSLDPLDDDKHSPWNTLRKDEEIRAEIFQDIERCMPEEPYFRRADIQRLMLDVLFIFCKINQDVGYRQGMHEILAPILWVVEQDSIDPGDINSDSAESETDSPDSIMKQCLDRKFIEHDAFTLLSLVMRSAKSFYELGDPGQRTPQIGGGTPQNGASPIVERSKRIHEIYLARVDPRLAKHLTDIEILPQIFLIRWIRLLFGREFPFVDLLSVWDTLFAEDPELDLVDLICVAMLLRIRWQLMESNYSLALMLLLKYECPPNPQTFVDDAIFLRDNFNASGGSQIIHKYSGKQPQPRQLLMRNRSSLTTPARFLQQQGGVEALIQGAAKGVYNRGERLGINQAVRDAMEEVKKNMQGLQTPRSNNSPRRASGASRWSLDDGRVMPASTAIMATMNERNRQLAVMLDHAMKDLRSVSVSEESNREKCVEAMEMAIAKVDFVKVYLEDSTMPLPILSPNINSRNEPAKPEADTPKVLSPPISDHRQTSSPETPTITSDPGNALTKDTNDLDESSISTPDISQASREAIDLSSNERSTIIEPKMEREDMRSATTERPEAPIPTRSSIAQSSFSWMLEPDQASSPTAKSSPPKSSSPFLRTGKRPTSGAGREKAAFLFGDDDGDFQLPIPKSPMPNAEEAFKLGTLKRIKEKVDEHTDE